MTTEVILTGTGVPHARPGCAGAGTLVRCGDVALQFDAGRSTVMRLMEAGTAPHELTAVFLTHVHSDHLVGLPDLVMTRWTHGRLEAARTAGGGRAGGWGDTVRRAHARALRRRHRAADRARRRRPDRDRPPPVRGAHRALHGLDERRRNHPRPRRRRPPRTRARGRGVPGRDTRRCGRRSRATPACATRSSRSPAAPTSSSTRRAGPRRCPPFIAGTTLETIFSYHADTVPLGAMAARAGVPHVVLTHLIPPIDKPGDADAFAEDLRAGGYEGTITVGTDLTSVTLG